MSKNPRPILAVNSGSSTLKFGLFAADGGEERTLVKGGADGIGKDAGTLEILDADGKTLLSASKKFASQTDALSHITSSLKSLGFPEPVAVGHRIVHADRVCAIILASPPTRWLHSKHLFTLRRCIYRRRLR